MSFLPARRSNSTTHTVPTPEALSRRRKPEFSTQWPRAAVVFIFSTPLIATLSGITRFCHS
jgi:hypothetical protein